MTENVRKFEKALREDEELRARFAAEFKRIAEEKSALNDIEAYVKAAKALGFELSLTEAEKPAPKPRNWTPKKWTRLPAAGAMAITGAWIAGTAIPSAITTGRIRRAPPALRITTASQSIIIDSRMEERGVSG